MIHLGRFVATAFYRTREWREVRYRALVMSKGKCEACGRDGHDAVLHVDHIKPKSKHPELALKVSNLQVLCEDCNLGKSNTDETDWRDRITRRALTKDEQWAWLEREHGIKPKDFP